MSLYPYTSGAVTPLRNASNSSGTRTPDAGIPQDFSIKKAFKAFGGISSRRKLASLRTVFPHADKVNVKDISSIYDEVLAYARPGLYADSAVRPAMKMIAEQIATRQVKHLNLALQRCAPAEVEQFLLVLMTACMDDIEESSDTIADSKGKGAKLTMSNTLILIPVLSWIVQVAQHGEVPIQVVIKAGILDILLRIYIILPALSNTSQEEANHQLALVDVCRFTLDTISQMCQRAGIPYHHPVYTLWSDCQPQPPGYTRRARDGPTSDRAAAWRLANPSCVRRRLLVIYRGGLWRSHVNSTADMEACYDILEFARPQFYDAETVKWAFLAALKHITAHGESARHLIRLLARSFHDDIVYLLSGVLRLWLECVSHQVQESLRSASRAAECFGRGRFDAGFDAEQPITVEVDKSAYDRERERLLRKVVGLEAAAHNILKFATQLASESAAMRVGLLEAGSLVLVLATFANEEFTMPSLLYLTKLGKRKTMVAHLQPTPAPVPLSVINAEASTLSLLIYQPAFRAGWESQRLQTRLSLCAILVDALFVDGPRGSDGCYEISRALCRKITDARA